MKGAMVWFGPRQHSITAAAQVFASRLHRYGMWRADIVRA
jgi:hypothetical protein